MATKKKPVCVQDPPPKLRTVLVDVTFQMEVPCVTVGQRDRPLRVRLQRDAEAMVRESITAMDWGGYSMLGKAFTKRGLDPWEAIRMTVVTKRVSTMRERLVNKGRDILLSMAGGW